MIIREVIDKVKDVSDEQLKFLNKHLTLYEDKLREVSKDCDKEVVNKYDISDDDLLKIFISWHSEFTLSLREIKHKTQLDLVRDFWHTGGNTREERLENTYDKIVKKLNELKETAPNIAYTKLEDKE